MDGDIYPQKQNDEKKQSTSKESISAHSAGGLGALLPIEEGRGSNSTSNSSRERTDGGNISPDNNDRSRRTSSAQAIEDSEEFYQLQQTNVLLARVDRAKMTAAAERTTSYFLVSGQISF